MQGWLVRSWRNRGLLSAVLQPISWVYGSLAAFRRQLYRWELLKSHRLRVPVVVVGNVVAGGAGKTPTTIAIVQHLTSQGLRVGVLSRGYGRSNRSCIEASDGVSPRDAGDEPLLIHKKTNVPVFVASERKQAGNALLARYPNTQIIVCDDGLQHYGLYRDLEICVFDDRGCGNNRLLPSGPLRQHWPRTLVRSAGQNERKSILLHTGKSPAFAGPRSLRRLASHGVLISSESISLDDLANQHSRKLVAVAGTSQPEEFFSMLRSRGLQLHATIPLPDHYDFDSWNRTPYERCCLICTEKDAIKLWRVAPDAICIGLEFEPDSCFWADFDAQVPVIVRAKLSSTHGHKTT